MRGCEVDSKSQFYILCVMNIEIVGLNGVPEQNPHKQALFTVTHQNIHFEWCRQKILDV